MDGFFVTVRVPDPDFDWKRLEGSEVIHLGGGKLEPSGDERPYSALMPANLITFAHFSVASAMIVANSAGEPPSTVPPSSTIRVLILASARPALISLFNRLTISAGVLLGTPMPAKPLAS